MPIETTTWLRGLGLEQYAAAFEKNAIEEAVLRELTAEDLRELGVVLIGHRRKMLAAIAALRASPNPITLNSSVLSDDHSADATAPERRQLTVMFCDLVDSTALAARLDPEDLREVVGVYQSTVTEEAQRFGGNVAKYMGDGVLIYFGYPNAQETDAERALQAGLAITQRIPTLKTGGVKLSIRVGVATGIVVVGDLIGSGAAQERGVVGQTPNLAARPQALAAPDCILVAESTRRLAGDLFEYRDLGEVELKGIPETTRVWQVLRQGNIESRFEAFHRSALTPLVGRAKELELLTQHWRQARSGLGQVALLSGEPGIGKSRLLAAVQDTLASERHTKLRYFCSPHYSNSALYPFMAAFGRAAGFELDEPATARLLKLEALLAKWGVVDAPTTMAFRDFAGLALEPDQGRRAPDPARLREMTLAAHLALFEATARRSPLVVFFEDAHWADATSLELLNRIVGWSAGAAMLLVITLRPEFKAPWIGQRHVTSLSLSRLSQTETSALVNEVGAGKMLPKEVLQRIVERTDGVPLFVEALTKTLIESPFQREEAQSYVLDGPLPPMAIPASLHASLMARLDRFAHVKEIAQIAAALGREFSIDVLAAVARREDNQLMLALKLLEEAGIVLRYAEPPNAAFMFKHALIQDAAYSTLLRGQRQQLHARIGRVLEDKFGEVAGTPAGNPCAPFHRSGNDRRGYPVLEQGRRACAPTLGQRRSSRASWLRDRTHPRFAGGWPP
jgi:class 3 adenylate cyclase